MLICNHWFHAFFIILYKDFGKNTVKRMFMIDLHITLCVCRLYLCIVVCGHICDC